MPALGTGLVFRAEWRRRSRRDTLCHASGRISVAERVIAFPIQRTEWPRHRPEPDTQSRRDQGLTANDQDGQSLQSPRMAVGLRSLARWLLVEPCHIGSISGVRRWADERRAVRRARSGRTPVVAASTSAKELAPVAGAGLSIPVRNERRSGGCSQGRGGARSGPTRGAAAFDTRQRCGVTRQRSDGGVVCPHPAGRWRVTTAVTP